MKTKRQQKVHLLQMKSSSVTTTTTVKSQRLEKFQCPQPLLALTMN